MFLSLRLSSITYNVLATSGNLMVKVVPLFFSLATRISPSCFLIMSYEILSPSPVPLPTSLVVKNGSKIRFKCSVSIPLPVSEI
jgi:hypothetical protein